MRNNPIISRCLRLVVGLAPLVAATLAPAQAPTGGAGPAQLNIALTPAVLPAVQELAPRYLSQRHIAVKIESGGSMGTTGTAIPARLDRGEIFDVVIVFNGSIDDLIRRGKLLPGSKVDLVRSDIGLGFKSGAPKPDIHNAEALKQVLLAAKSITYTSGVSGIYVRDVMFPKLGIADQMKAKTLLVSSAGEAVAAGQAEFGFQQVSELMPVKGVEILHLPRDAAEPSIFSAGIPVNAPHPKEAKAFIEWLASPAAYNALRNSGLGPFNAN